MSEGRSSGNMSFHKITDATVVERPCATCGHAKASHGTQKYAESFTPSHCDHGGCECEEFVQARRPAPKCNHDPRYALFGAVNGCLACQSEETAAELTAARSLLDVVADAPLKLEIAVQELAGLKAAITSSGYAVMKAANGLSIHDVSEAGRIEAERTAEVISENIDLKIELDHVKLWQTKVMDVANKAFNLNGCCHWETVCEAIERLTGERDAIVVELEKWRPLTHAEAQAAYDAAEAVPMSEERIAEIVAKATDPANRIDNDEQAALVAEVRRLTEQVAILKGSDALAISEANRLVAERTAALASISGIDLRNGHIRDNATPDQLREMLLGAGMQIVGIRADLAGIANRLPPVAAALMQRACGDAEVHEETCNCYTCRAFLATQDAITRLGKIVEGKVQ